MPCWVQTGSWAHTARPHSHEPLGRKPTFECEEQSSVHLWTVEADWEEVSEDRGGGDGNILEFDWESAYTGAHV